MPPAVAHEHHSFDARGGNRSEHGKGWILQDHRRAVADMYVWCDHRRHVFQRCFLRGHLAAGVAQAGQQHDRVIDVHELKARVGAIGRTCTSLTMPP